MSPHRITNHRGAGMVIMATTIEEANEKADRICDWRDEQSSTDDGYYR
ncbi:hypothetical protein SEA_BEARBQ_41 [Gordonia phage BearBQ]|nr:hypothetical protein SEA_BEARBQ_41 [Gordonia phage BearBQ]